MSWLRVLVHNTCLHTLAKQGITYAENILKGIRFNQIMVKRMADQKLGAVHDLWLKAVKGKKARVDTIIPGKKIISRKASQLAEVTYDTSKKHIDELTTKYKRGREIVNTERAGAEKLAGDYVLQVPKTKKYDTARCVRLC